MITEITFATVCGIICAVLLWAATTITEPFYLCIAVFTAAFWGAIAALAVWGRLSAWGERERRRDFMTIIMPDRRP